MKYLIFLLLVLAGCSNRNKVAYSRSLGDKIVLVNSGTTGREDIAELVDRINLFDPKVVAIDFQFSTEKEKIVDDKFVAALRKCKNLVMVSMIDNYSVDELFYDKLIPGTLPKFTGNAKTGFANLIVEEGQFDVLKRFSQWEYVDGSKELSFALQVANSFDSVKTKEFRLSHSKVCSVDYTLEKFTVLSIDDFLSDRVDKESIEGKIVMIGFLGPGDMDRFFSPSNNTSSPDLYGLEFHAYVVQQVLSN